MGDVSLDLIDSKDEAQVALRGRMFHSLGRVTAKDESSHVTKSSFSPISFLGSVFTCHFLSLHRFVLALRARLRDA